MNKAEIKCAIEAILFANGAPVQLDTISKALEIKQTQAKEAINELIAEYNNDNHGIAIIRLEESYQFCNKKAYGEYIRRVMDLKRNAPLSQAALEVLAVIAYNQPVTKAFVEQVRGVDCSGVVGSLTTKGLIEEKGRLDELKLYQTVERLAPEVIAKVRKMYKGISANIDFYSGFVYSMLNLPHELYTPIFAVARIAGWSAHRIEEIVNRGKIIRPAYKSITPLREYTELRDRK